MSAFAAQGRPKSLESGFLEILTYAIPDNKRFVCHPGAHDILKHTIPKVLTYAPTRFMDFICHQAEKKAGPQSLQTRLFPRFFTFLKAQKKPCPQLS